MGTCVSAAAAIAQFPSLYIVVNEISVCKRAGKKKHKRLFLTQKTKVMLRKICQSSGSTNKIIDAGAALHHIRNE